MLVWVLYLIQQPSRRHCNFLIRRPEMKQLLLLNQINKITLSYQYSETCPLMSNCARIFCSCTANPEFLSFQQLKKYFWNKFHIVLLTSQANNSRYLILTWLLSRKVYFLISFLAIHTIFCYLRSELWENMA